MPRFVVTGAPGTGKTAVISLLSEGYPTVEEPARRLITQHAIATGETTLDNRPDLFVRRMVKSAIEGYASVTDDVVAFFDRGLPDCVAYAAVFGLDQRDVLEDASRLRYDSRVFIARPWEEIYTRDAVRRATFEQVKAFDAHLQSAYLSLGYRLIELPRATPRKRVETITRVLELDLDRDRLRSTWEPSA